MSYIEIYGNKPLDGSIKLHGAKNSVLPILAATLLVKGECVIKNAPHLSDVGVCIEILNHLGADCTFIDGTLIVNTKNVTRTDIPKELTAKMRSSIVFLGALAASQGRAQVSLPGGCRIGERPIDMHLCALSALGYEIKVSESYVKCIRQNARANAVTLPFPSVGATENVILASVLLKGRTTICNAAREPEIKDLADFLVSAGAKIHGAGSSVITIDGVNSLHSTEHTVISDRILASTLMSAVAITGGDVLLRDIDLPSVRPVLGVFKRMGAELVSGNKTLRVKVKTRPRGVELIKTNVYPGFPTDSQAPVMAALCRAKGTSVIVENIFENRMMHAKELLRFGADIVSDNKTALVYGKPELHGADAYCTDLRGGAAVVIAGLGAKGVSRIYNIHHIDRGYEKLENQLAALGADIRRIENEKENQPKTE